MKCVKQKIIQEFVYSSEEERAKHVEIRKNEGWSVGGRSMRLRPDLKKPFGTETDEDYEWFAEFSKIATKENDDFY